MRRNGSGHPTLSRHPSQIVGKLARALSPGARAFSYAPRDRGRSTGTAEGNKLVRTIRLDGTKHRIWTWTEAGVKLVENGIWTEQKYEMPWLNKCGG